MKRQAERDDEIKIAYDESGAVYLLTAEGVHAQHIVELLQAEEEKRLMVLSHGLDADYPNAPSYFSITDKNTIEEHRLDCIWASIFLCGLINGTKFFTRPEAEAALKTKERESD